MSKYGDNIRKISRYDELKKAIRQVQETADQAKKLSLSATKSIAFLDKRTLGTATAVGSTALTPGQVVGGVNTNTQSTPTGQIGGTAGGEGIGEYNYQVNDNTGGGAVIPPAADGSGGGGGGSTAGTGQPTDNNNPENGHGNNGTSDTADGSSNPSGDAEGATSENKTGQHDGYSLLNGTPDADGKQPPIPSTASSGDSSWKGGTVNKIVGLKDEDSGRSLVAILGGAGIGLNYIGPSNWDDPHTPPPTANWEQGYYYNTGGATTYLPTNTVGATKYLTALAVANASVGYVHPAFGYVIEEYRNLELAGGTETSTGTYTVDYYLNWDSTGTPINTGWYSNTINLYKKDCNTDYNAEFCTITELYDTAWPDLGTTQLSFVMPILRGMPLDYAHLVGRFVPNQYDTNVPVKFLNGVSIIDALLTEDDTPVRLHPLKDGGWAFFERNPADSNNPAGAVTDNSVLVIRSNRTVEGFITPNQFAKRKP
jgi:hypothetical protein